MELPDLGKHCSEETCHKLDFLPMKCDACQQIFCNEHYNYLNHKCPSAYKKDIQVPVCPLCNKPIPIPRGQQPDIVVGAHIDSDCQSDPAKSRRKVFTNRCSMKGCRTKEIVPVLCKDCSQNYCLKHRHFVDHNCKGQTTSRKNDENAALSAEQTKAATVALLEEMDEDEAYAYALALSLQEQSISKNVISQEELDEALARQLQQENTRTERNTRGHSLRERCELS